MSDLYVVAPLYFRSDFSSALLCVCAFVNSLWHRYTLRVWTVDQAGWVSAQFATYSWHVLPVAPSVMVHQRPQSSSAAWRPEFTLSAVWGTAQPPQGGVEALVLEFLLLGDKERGRCDLAIVLLFV